MGLFTTLECFVLINVDDKKFYELSGKRNIIENYDPENKKLNQFILYSKKEYGLCDDMKTELIRYFNIEKKVDPFVYMKVLGSPGYGIPKDETFEDFGKDVSHKSCWYRINNFPNSLDIVFGLLVHKNNYHKVIIEYSGLPGVTIPYEIIDADEKIFGIKDNYYLKFEIPVALYYESRYIKLMNVNSDMKNIFLMVGMILSWELRNIMSFEYKINQDQ